MTDKKRKLFFGAISWRSLTVFLLLLVSVLLFAPNLKVENHLTNFFPNDNSSPQNQIFLKTLAKLLQNSSFDQPVLLSVTANADEESLAALSKSLKAILENAKVVKKVTNANPNIFRIEHQLNSYRYLLTDFRAHDISEAIETLWSAWQLGVVLDKKDSLSDPTNQWLHYLKGSFFASRLPTKDGVWLVPQTKGRDNAQALMLIELNHEAVFPIVSIEDVVETFENAHKSQQVKVRYSSASTIAYQARKQIQTQVTVLSAAASFIVLAFLFWVFRKPVWVLFSFVPLVAASWLGALAVYMLFGSIEAITLALGIVLIGVSVDYPIHVFSATLKTPSQKEQVWRVVRLGGITSAFGFLVLVVLGIEGFKQIAVFATVGLLSALMMSRMLMLDMTSALSNHEDHTLLTGDKLQTETSKNNEYQLRFVWVGLLMLLIVFLWRSPVSWQDDLASLSPVPASLLKQDHELRILFSQPESTQFLMLQASSVEDLLQKEEALTHQLQLLKHQGIIKQSLSLSNWLPSQKLQEQRMQALPSRAELDQLIAHQHSPLNSKVLKPFIDAVENTKQLPLLTLEMFKEKAVDWQKRLLPLLVTHDELSKSEWTGKVLLTGISSGAAMEAWSKQNQVLYFNQRAFVADAVQTLRGQLLNLSSAVLGVFALLLLWQQRSVMQAIDILIPVTLGVLITFICLNVWAGQLSIFHLLASLLLIAIGIDYSLFVQAASVKNKEYDSAHQAAKEILHSVPIAMATTVVSFGLLLFTQIPILVAIGQTIVLGVPLVYLFSRLYHRF
ncbi:MMPL family transporter [Hydrogenovibrio kuenenii]|uniref:MMPL family transporter n=1 Tax=Hydrogenovibrio kuenenii TaxID=63658 RepID=UPI0004637B42|nr:MMPL family transporter [Hydrogenovibrio kuenenii]